MNSYVIMSNEKGEYEKFSDMIKKNDPKCTVTRVRDASEAYSVAKDYRQPVCIIGIEHVAAAGTFTADLSAEETGQFARERLGELKRYIELNLGSRLSLDELAGKMYITPNYLSSIFRKYEKVTLVQYIETARMRKAKFILETETGRTVREVGREVGYESMAYFSRIFKKHFGLTPLRFQKKCRKDKTAVRIPAQRSDRSQ